MLDQLASIAEREFLLDMGLVGFDGFDAKVQFVCDAPRSVPFTDQTEHFQFPVREI
jgi:hypothetical protein